MTKVEAFDAMKCSNIHVSQVGFIFTKDLRELSSHFILCFYPLTISYSWISYLIPVSIYLLQSRSLKILLGGIKGPYKGPCIISSQENLFRQLGFLQCFISFAIKKIIMEENRDWKLRTWTVGYANNLQQRWSPGVWGPGPQGPSLKTVFCVPPGAILAFGTDL